MVRLLPSAMRKPNLFCLPHKEGGDDNVHYQSCEMMVSELIRHGKVFSQISYPMRSDSINEREGTTFHLRKSMVDYWKKNLPAGGK